MKRLNTNPHIVSRTFKENGFFPNNIMPLLVYKTALLLPAQESRAAGIVQNIFLKNGWSNSWRNGIYDFHHYHSNTHEVLGIAAGSAKVIFGGPGKHSIEVKQGDVIIIPAGVVHKCVSFDETFLCVGAYPSGKEYDICLGTEAEFKRTLKKIKNVPQPKNDPVFGNEGFLKSFWKDKC